jgi:ABC-type antimicrobial peptide transport system permease subunit
MNDEIAGSLATRRFSMILLSAFAGAALLLASIGLYGVIRRAMGAQRTNVLGLVLNHGLKMAFGGVALGILGALSLTRLLGNLLYGVEATDIATFTTVALLLTAVALLACLIPAWRATKVDPLTALSHE